MLWQVALSTLKPSTPFREFLSLDFPRLPPGTFENHLLLPLGSFKRSRMMLHRTHVHTILLLPLGSFRIVTLFTSF